MPAFNGNPTLFFRQAESRFLKAGAWRSGEAEPQ